MNLDELYVANPEFGIDTDRLLRELDHDGIVAYCERNLRRECMISGVKRIEVACGEPTMTHLRVLPRARGRYPESDVPGNSSDPARWISRRLPRQPPSPSQARI